MRLDKNSVFWDLVSHALIEIIMKFDYWNLCLGSKKTIVHMYKQAIESILNITLFVVFEVMCYLELCNITTSYYKFNIISIKVK